MPWTHISSPALGMITKDLPFEIPPKASPRISGMYIKDGEVVSDFGYVDFPTAGATKTNRLNGAVMKIDTFHTANGIERLLAFTTTNAYQYNTSTKTWDNITKGTLIHDCETAWVSSQGANVIATADTTYKLRNTKSCKLVVSADASTGTLAAATIDSTDLSDETAYHLWVYSTIALSANDLAIYTGAPPVTVNIPAVAANTWIPVCVTASLGSSSGVTEVGVNMNVDKGAFTIYIDDVRAVDKFTGDEDNHFSTTTMNDTFIVTNGIDQPQKYTGATLIVVGADLTTTLAAGAITTAEVVFTFKDHLFLMNNTENGADCPQRVSWTNIGQLEDWTGGTAGYQDLVDELSWIMCAAALTENDFAIYKEESIVLATWTGGHTPFRFFTMVPNVGVVSKNGVDNRSGIHAVIGQSFIYTYKGAMDFEPLDSNVNSTIYNNLNYDVQNRSFITYIKEDNELQVWIPTTTDYPDEVWCYNSMNKNWYVKSRSMNYMGFYQSATSLTIGDLTGTIGEQNWTFGSMLVKASTPISIVGDTNGKIYKLDKTTLNDNGSAISNEFQTPEFMIPDTSENVNRHMRVSQLLFEAYGQSVTTTYSTDGGATWNPTMGASGNVVTLAATRAIYQQDFDVLTRRIRFKFANTSVSSGFHLAYYGFRWEIRSGR